jgi:seryl-tRNA synthetase
MLDIKFIRQNPEVVKEALRKRGDHFDFEKFLMLDSQRRNLIVEIDSLRAEQNRLNDEVSFLIKEKKDTREKIKMSKEISEKLDLLLKEFNRVKKEFERKLLDIPNIPHSSVPEGDASCNVVIRNEGELRSFNYKPLSHIELGEHLGVIDFKRAAKMSGSNFVLFKGEGARLERALINFMLDMHTKEHNYQEVFPPFLVNRIAMTTTGQLPRLEEDMYRLKDDDYFLIPTAEVCVTNIHYNEILEESDLPIYYSAYTACFRREAGSYGKETKGLVRVHQFDKIELVKFVKPQDSYSELEKLLKDACRVIELLRLPYRVVLLSTKEISFAASKCYDIEVYAPGIDKWLEVSSCSNFEDFQARRGNIRYRDKKTGKTKFVHTLNGSGVALARLVIAILENYQQKDGSIIIPEVLRRYLDGRERFTA